MGVKQSQFGKCQKFDPVLDLIDNLIGNINDCNTLRNFNY